MNKNLSISTIYRKVYSNSEKYPVMNKLPFFALLTVKVSAISNNINRLSRLIPRSPVINETFVLRYTQAPWKYSILTLDLESRSISLLANSLQLFFFYNWSLLFAKYFWQTSRYQFSMVCVLSQLGVHALIGKALRSREKKTSPTAKKRKGCLTHSSVLACKTSPNPDSSCTFSQCQW